MPKPASRTKLNSFILPFLACNLSGLLLWGCWSFINHHTLPIQSQTHVENIKTVYKTRTQNWEEDDTKMDCDSPEKTFYDEQNLSYSIETPMQNWDEKRKKWLEQRPSLAAGAHDRIFMLTGSQPSACKSPIGDHLLLRFFKNKVDYARIHGYDLFYNNAFLHPKMGSVWSKLPVLRSAMIAHPEAEWIWWIDADAAITDIEFKIPLEKYKDYNFVVNGWADLLYKEKKWMSVNSGVFLIRNCQWSMNFLDAWASMGPQTPNYARWSKIHRDIMKDLPFSEADDQSSLVYLMLKEKEKWTDKIYLETEYEFNGYWEILIRIYANVTSNILEMESRVPRLRRRHAEKVRVSYGALREQCMDAINVTKDVKWTWRRPFITHFAGCSLCSNHFPRFDGDTSLIEMERALNSADNQVLRIFGYIRRDQLGPELSLLPFDFPIHNY